MLLIVVKMRVVVVGLLLVAVVSGYQDVQKYYHEAVGIPEAARIKAAEEKIALEKTLLDDRIVGGAIAPANAHPYLVSLLVF